MQNTLLGYSKNIPKILVINMACYYYETQWHASNASVLSFGEMRDEPTIKCHVNYQYFWNIFGIFYKCILHFLLNKGDILQDEDGGPMETVFTISDH